jgi:hypothetical protein
MKVKAGIHPVLTLYSFAWKGAELPHELMTSSWVDDLMKISL